MDAIETRILDAALEAVAAGAVDDGRHRARAGVGRVTLFRRFGSKDALLQRLYAREVERFLGRRSTPRCRSSTTRPTGSPRRSSRACARASRHPLLATVPRGVALEALAARPAGRRAPVRRRPRSSPAQEAQADLLVRLALTYVLIPGAARPTAGGARLRARLPGPDRYSFRDVSTTRWVSDAARAAIVTR